MKPLAQPRISPWIRGFVFLTSVVRTRISRASSPNVRLLRLLSGGSDDKAFSTGIVLLIQA
jgi:hypothetical protein